MVGGRTQPKLRLISGAQQSPVDRSLRLPAFPLPGETQFPSPPAMPEALLQLELGLTASVVDLQDVTNTIKGDLGLTLQLLRLASQHSEVSSGEISGISNLVIQVGLSELYALARHTMPVPYDLRRAAASGCQRLWTRSRLIALIAEDLAGQSSEVTAEEAYLAGLLCHAGVLPLILGWPAAGSDAASYCPIGWRMARAWQLPEVLATVMGGYREARGTCASPALLSVVEAAAIWAGRLESLAIRQANKP